MNHAVKGLLLSGLVIPGLGQIVLKYYFRGMVFMLATVGGLIVMVVEAIRIITDLVSAVAANLEMVEIEGISTALHQVLAETSLRTMGAALLVVLLAWGISMVDAYRIGHRMDAQGVVQAPGPG